MNITDADALQAYVDGLASSMADREISNLEAAVWATSRALSVVMDAADKVSAAVKDVQVDISQKLRGQEPCDHLKHEMGNAMKLHLGLAGIAEMLQEQAVALMKATSESRIIVP